MRQAAFLALNELEALYGGAAGGGKSEALLMAALQYIDLPGYAALLMRRRITDASLPGALMVRSHEWLAGSGARYDEKDRTWSFPSGATLSFGYLDRKQDRYRYQSSEFQFIGFDELTQFDESEYLYLFSRLRRSTELSAPLRMRAASNPGGAGHDWVKRRFLVEGPNYKRIFLPARLTDNPHIDRAAYVRSLTVLDHVTRRQLLEGDWNVDEESLIRLDDVLACQADCLWNESRTPSRARELTMGVDVGRTRDLTVIWTWERLGDVHWCREMTTLKRASFREQKRAIEERLARGVIRCAIDKGGIGYQLAEELEQQHPGIVEGVVLSPGTQARLAMRLAVAFRERRVRIPIDRALEEDLRLVRRPRNVGGIDRIETTRNWSGHADRFWSAALALDASASVLPTFTLTASLPRGIRKSPH